MGLETQKMFSFDFVVAPPMRPLLVCFPMMMFIWMLVSFTLLGQMIKVCSDVPVLSVKQSDCIQVRKSHLGRLTISFLWFCYFDLVAHVCVFLISLWAPPSRYLMVVTCAPHFSGSLSLRVFISFPVLSSGPSLPWQSLLPLLILFSIFLSCRVCS